MHQQTPDKLFTQVRFLEINRYIILSSEERKKHIYKVELFDKKHSSLKRLIIHQIHITLCILYIIVYEQSVLCV